MKKLVLIIITTILSMTPVFAQYNVVAEKPEPLPAQDFSFPDYKTFNLSNGMKIILIQDKEQPTYSMRLLLPGGTSIDTSKPGTADLTATMLLKGCKGLTAGELAETLDGLGINLSVNALTDFTTIESSGLVKHFDKFLEIFEKILYSPTFNEEELEKAKKQLLSQLQYEKGEPRTLASKLASKVIYGENHPYSTFPTTESVKSITVSDIRDYYEKYYVPNQSSIAIIGDFETLDMLNKIKNSFKDWEKQEKLIIKIPSPKQLPKGVYFVKRPGAVQSTIQITYKAIPYSNRNYDKLSLAASVISGGISGRLFRVLREEHSYTYTPYGNLTRNKYAGRYYCGADVKNPVTDSAINVIFEQVHSLSKQLMTEQELNRVKNYKAGSFKMTFENSAFIANLVQRALFYKLDVDYLEQYPERILSYTKYDVKDIASKHLTPENSFIVVVGNPEVKSKLTKYGKIYEYDLNLNPLSGENAKLEKVSMDAEELLENYVDAIGGRDKLNNVNTLIDSVHTTMDRSGQIQEGILMQYQKAPNKKYFILNMETFKQQTWVDGSNVWIGMNDMTQKIENKEADKMLYDAIMFKDANLLQNDFNCKVLGKINGQILMKAISPRGFASTYYFNEKTYLIDKIERVEEIRNGTIPITETFKKYSIIDEIKLPTVIETTSPLYTITTKHNYKLNVEIEDNMFNPK